MGRLGQVTTLILPEDPRVSASRTVYESSWKRTLGTWKILSATSLKEIEN